MATTSAAFLAPVVDDAADETPADVASRQLDSGAESLVELTATGFKHSLVLPDRDHSGAYDLEFALPDGVTVRQVESGAVEFLDPAGEPVGSFGGGFAWDSTDPEHPEATETPVTTTLTATTKTTATVRVAVDTGWYEDPARVFPVTIDPTWVQEIDGDGADSYDTYVRSDTFSGSGSFSSTRLRVGQWFFTDARARSLLRFDLPAADADALVFNAELDLYARNTFALSCEERAVEVQGLDAGFSSSTHWYNQPATDSYGPVSSSSFPTTGPTCAGDWVTMDATALAQRWLDGAQTNHGLQVSAEDEYDDAGLKEFYSGNNASEHPVLTIDYTTDPTARLDTPTDGETVFETEQLVASTGGTSGIDHVDFLVDDVVVDTDSDGSDGWTGTWDTTAETDGEHDLKAVAVDGFSIEYESPAHTVTVDNTLDSPARVRADHAAGKVTSNEYALLIGDALLRPQELTARYQGSNDFSGHATTELLHSYAEVWDGLDSTTVAEIRDRHAVAATPGSADPAFATAHSLDLIPGPASTYPACDLANIMWGVVNSQFGIWCTATISYNATTCSFSDFDCAGTSTEVPDLKFFFTVGNDADDVADDENDNLGITVPQYLIDAANSMFLAFETHDDLGFELGGNLRTEDLKVVLNDSDAFANPYCDSCHGGSGGDFGVVINPDDPYATPRHEAFHIMQYNYVSETDVLGDFLGVLRESTTWWLEATAEWADHKVVETHGLTDRPTDYAGRFFEFADDPNRKLTEFTFSWPWEEDAGSQRQYGAFVRDVDRPTLIVDDVSPEDQPSERNSSDGKRRSGPEEERHRRHAEDGVRQRSRSGAVPRQWLTPTLEHQNHHDDEINTDRRHSTPQRKRIVPQLGQYGHEEFLRMSTYRRYQPPRPSETSTRSSSRTCIASEFVSGSGSAISQHLRGSMALMRGARSARSQAVA